MAGKLIVIEGACDGIGKSTQYELLKEYLEQKGYKVCSHHFPTYNSKAGFLAENYLKGEFGSPKNLSPYLINTMYAVDRAIIWKDKLKKEYDNGSIILLDRYTTSSLIYQTSLLENYKEKEVFINYVSDYEYKKLGIKKPDKVIFLTANFNIVRDLRNKRKDNDGVVNDVYERDEELMKKIYDNSSFVSKLLNFDEIVCDDGKNMKSIEDIQKDIQIAIKEIL